MHIRLLTIQHTMQLLSIAMYWPSGDFIPHMCMDFSNHADIFINTLYITRTPLLPHNTQCRIIIRSAPTVELFFYSQ